MNDIVKFSPAAGGVGFAKGAKAFGANRPIVQTGIPLLVLQRLDGVWVHSSERIEVEPGSKWVIDANTTCQGYVAWHAGMPTERMSFVGQELIDPQTLPPTPAKDGWVPQVGFGLICLDGEDKGLHVLYKANTQGAIKAWNATYDAMEARAAQGLGHNPVVELESWFYRRKEDNGIVWNPTFKIIGWMGDDQAQIESDADDPKGDMIDEDIPFMADAKPKVEPEPEPPVRGTRRQRRNG